MGKNVVLNVVFILILLIYGGLSSGVFCQVQQEQRNSLVREPFSYLSDDQTTTIHGEIVLPDTPQINNCPFVIFVQPPAFPLDKDYLGLFKTLADSFAENGIVTLRFENRSHANSIYKNDSLSSTMEARDIYKAIVAVKKDQRFKYLKLGLLGHSEGNNAILEEMHHHGQPDFIILLSPMGLNGNDFTFHQMKGALLKFTRNKVDSSVSSFLSYMQEILNLEYENQDNLDTLKAKFKDAVAKSYARGGHGKLTFEENYRFQVKDFLNPRFLAYVQFNAALYYSSITCPALILYGKEDERLDYKTNSRNIDTLFKVNNKTNYKIISFDSINHNFKKINTKKGVDQNVMNVIFTWIKKQ